MKKLKNVFVKNLIALDYIVNVLRIKGCVQPYVVVKIAIIMNNIKI